MKPLSYEKHFKNGVVVQGLMQLRLNHALRKFYLADRLLRSVTVRKSSISPDWMKEQGLYEGQPCLKIIHHQFNLSSQPFPFLFLCFLVSRNTSVTASTCKALHN